MPPAQKLYLVWQLSRRDVAARYRESALGLLWSFVSPLAMLVVYTFVFSEVFQARWVGGGGGDKVDFALNLFVGIIVHGFFAECAMRASNLIVQNSNYVKRVVFPLWLLAPVTVISALFHMLISFTVLFGALIYFREGLAWQVVFLPAYLLPLVLLTLGVVWLLAALGAFLRDIGQVIPVVVTAMMFMSPVFYPVSALPERFQPWLYLNPLTPAIEMARALIIHGQVSTMTSWLWSMAVSCFVVLLGAVVFRRLKKGFADVM